MNEEKHYPIVCPNCHHSFEVAKSLSMDGPLADLFDRKGSAWCPDCGKRIMLRYRPDDDTIIVDGLVKWEEGK